MARPEAQLEVSLAAQPQPAPRLPEIFSIVLQGVGPGPALSDHCQDVSLGHGAGEELPFLHTEQH